MLQKLMSFLKKILMDLYLFTRTKELHNIRKLSFFCAKHLLVLGYGYVIFRSFNSDSFDVQTDTYKGKLV